MNGIKSFPLGKASISFVSLISRFSRFAICSEISSFSFLEFPETFKLFSSCPSSFHLPEVSRLPFAGFLCYEIFMVRIPFGISSPALGELFYSISFQAVCQELFFLFFSPSRRSRGLSETACLYYQIPSSLSIPFPLFFDKPKSLDVITSNISK